MKWLPSLLIVLVLQFSLRGGLAKTSSEEEHEDSEVQPAPESLEECQFGTKLRCKGNGMIETCDRVWNSTTQTYRHQCHNSIFAASDDYIDCCTPCCDRRGDTDVHQWCGEVAQEDFTCVPANCQYLYLNGVRISGLYAIQPDPSSEPIQVWCDMETEGGGWTVIQRRVDESVDFNRGWDEYEAGFGDPEGNYWMGLKYINLLTKHPAKLYIDLEEFSDKTAYAHYSRFSVGDADSDYQLHVRGYSGSAGNNLARDTDSAYLDGMKFSTWDRDNDLSSRHCVGCCGGPWWHRDCTSSALNGKYFPRGSHTDVSGQGVRWDGFAGLGESLKQAKMMIKL